MFMHEHSDCTDNVGGAQELDCYCYSEVQFCG